MEYSSYPAKKNTAFIKAVSMNYKDIYLNFGREKGYSIYIKSYPKKRWMMIDINSTGRRPHLFIAIDVKRGDFNSTKVSDALKIPTKALNKGLIQTQCWINDNQDSILFNFYDDIYGALDFESKEFLSFLELTYGSFIKR